jgi:hypothetical protein
MDRFNPSKREHKYSPEYVQGVAKRIQELGANLHLVNAAPIDSTPPQVQNVIPFPKAFVSPNYVPEPAPESVIDLHEDVSIVDDSYLEAMTAGDLTASNPLNLEAIRQQVEDARNSTLEQSDELAA